MQHIDLSWNTIEPSLVLMYQKLVGLGFVHYDGEIRIVEPETEGSNYHIARSCEGDSSETLKQKRWR